MKLSLSLSPKIPASYLTMELFNEILEYFTTKSFLIITIFLLNIWVTILINLSNSYFLNNLLRKAKTAAIGQQKKLQKRLKKIEQEIEIRVDKRTKEIRRKIFNQSEIIVDLPQVDISHIKELHSVKREQYLAALLEIQRCLLSLDDRIDCYQKILKILGETSGSGRVYLFKTHQNEADQLLINQLAEWCVEEIKPEINNPELQNISYEELFHRWKKSLQQDQIVAGVVSEFPASERAVLEARGIFSILLLPIIVKGNLFSFIGFDNCVEIHNWQTSEIDFLRAAATAISLAEERKQADNQLKDLNTKLEVLIKERTFELRKTLNQLQNEVSERKRTEQDLENLLSLQKATLEATVDGILVINRDNKITSYNQKFFQMWHIPQNIIDTLDCEIVFHFLVDQIKNYEGYLARVKEINEQPNGEYCDILEFKDGRIFERYCQPQRIGEEIVGRVWIFRDITERQMAENTIRYQALHDLLTDLPNRILFNERLSGALTKAHKNQGMLAVMFLDLDRFKTINDTLGHAFGDQLLQVVAERLTGCLWQHDTVARWGGDEFTLLLPQIHCAEDAERIAQRILFTLKQPIDMGDRHLHISGSIGIACYPQDGEDAETLLRNADVALYRAKEEGRHNYQFYRENMNSQASELLILENELHQALEKGEFVVHYQPQVSTTSGKITQMEALVRWKHSELGLISPAKFIPLAEENGLIIPIGEWVLRTACAQTKAWQDAGLSPLTIAVNLSARQFQQPNLVEMVARILAETGLEARFLELEITESVAMQNVDFSRGILRKLHNMGVLISMDDFGTGYSSLSYLKKFPLHKLKIDQSFVRDLTTDPNDAAIINAITALGKELNLKMVAEGVETEEQKNILISLQCEYMQGYLFSRPLSPEDATRLLQNCLLNVVKNACENCILGCNKE